MDKKIDSEDSTIKKTEVQEAIDDIMQEEAKSTQTLMDTRIAELRKVGAEDPLTASMAETIPTSVLMLTVLKFPELVGEIASALTYVEGDQAAKEDLIRSIQGLNEAFAVCAAEIDERMPARREAEPEADEVV